MSSGHEQKYPKLPFESRIENDPIWSTGPHLGLGVRFAASVDLMTVKKAIVFVVVDDGHEP